MYFKTSNSVARVTLGEEVNRNPSLLDRILANTADAGFITFKVEDFSELATFCDYVGNVLVIKKKDSKLDIPPVLREILEDPYTIKVGSLLSKVN